MWECTRTGRKRCFQKVSPQFTPHRCIIYSESEVCIIGILLKLFRMYRYGIYTISLASLFSCFKKYTQLNEHFNFYHFNEYVYMHKGYTKMYSFRSGYRCMHKSLRHPTPLYQRVNDIPLHILLWMRKVFHKE